MIQPDKTSRNLLIEPGQRVHGLLDSPTDTPSLSLRPPPVYVIWVPFSTPPPHQIDVGLPIQLASHVNGILVMRYQVRENHVS